MYVDLHKRSSGVVILPIVLGCVVVFCLIFWIGWRFYPRQPKQQDEKRLTLLRVTSGTFQLPLHYRTLDPWGRGNGDPRAMLLMSSVGVNSIEHLPPPAYASEKQPPQYPAPVYLV